MGKTLDAILNSPAIVRTAARSMGLDAARLDYDDVAGRLWLSIVIGGAVRHIPLPLGRTYTLDEILTLLFDAPHPPAPPP